MPGSSVCWDFRREFRWMCMCHGRVRSFALVASMVNSREPFDLHLHAC